MAVVKTWQKAAEEFGHLECPNRWELALLVARFAYRAEAGRKKGKDKDSAQGGPILNADGKASLSDFAAHAEKYGHGASPSTVKRYLDVWDQAASFGAVQKADVLKPSEEYRLPDRLRRWTEKAAEEWDTYRQAVVDDRAAGRAQARNEAQEEVRKVRAEGKEPGKTLLKKAGMDKESEPQPQRAEEAPLASTPATADDAKHTLEESLTAANRLYDAVEHGVVKPNSDEAHRLAERVREEIDHLQHVLQVLEPDEVRDAA